MKERQQIQHRKRITVGETINEKETVGKKKKQETHSNKWNLWKNETTMKTSIISKNYNQVKKTKKHTWVGEAVRERERESGRW